MEDRAPCFDSVLLQGRGTTLFGSWLLVIGDWLVVSDVRRLTDDDGRSERITAARRPAHRMKQRRRTDDDRRSARYTASRRPELHLSPGVNRQSPIDSRPSSNVHRRSSSSNRLPPPETTNQKPLTRNHKPKTKT